MARWQKKPVIVEAYQWNGPSEYQPGVKYDSVTGSHYVVTIHDQETYIEPGDFIIQEPDGEHYYPCKPDVFVTNYGTQTVPDANPYLAIPGTVSNLKSVAMSEPDWEFVLDALGEVQEQHHDEAEQAFAIKEQIQYQLGNRSN